MMSHVTYWLFKEMEARVFRTVGLDIYYIVNSLLESGRYNLQVEWNQAVTNTFSTSRVDSCIYKESVSKRPRIFLPLAAHRGSDVAGDSSFQGTDEPNLENKWWLRNRRWY